MNDQPYPYDSGAEPTQPLPYPPTQPTQPQPYPPAQYPANQYPPEQYPANQYPPAQYHPGHGPSMPYQYAPVHQVAPKNPALALLVSFFIPGVGSMMNGDVGKGIGILVGYVVSVFLVIVLIGFVGMLAFWIWGMVDAYQGAQKWNLRHGIMS